jgi:hypothetical protein
MAYVIVNTETQVRVIYPTTRKAQYETLRAARAAMTRLIKIDMEAYVSGRKYPRTNYEIMEESAYQAQIPLVKVRNLMSGKEIEIPADQAGTCVDPSTERYWSM